VRYEDVTDGISLTLFVGETIHERLGLGWASPLFVGGFTSAHPGVCNFAMGDGSVRVLTKSINTTILKQLAHRADGELIDESFFGY
jgi:prepilin-type processing-associated H-X9-DG protein